MHKEQSKYNNSILLRTWAVVLFAGAVFAVWIDKGDGLIFMSGLRSEALNSIFFAITQLGDTPAYLLVLPVLLGIRYRFALAAALIGVTNLLLSMSLKALFSHPRPLNWLQATGQVEDFESVPQYAMYQAFNSFPSGHTLSAFTLFIFLALISEKVWMKILFSIVPLLVALSRVYLGAHFVQDVVFGGACGLLLAYMGYLLQRQWFSKSNGLNKSLRQLIPAKHV